MEHLSARQRQILAFIRDFSRDTGYPPSFREIGAHVGLKSPSTVDHHLKKLRDLGVLHYEDGKSRSILLREDAVPPADRVPLVGSVAAGAPILAEENIEEYLPYDTNGRPEELFALRVRGESMLGAGILPGDVVVVRRQPTAESGQIVVALLEDEATVKTLSLSGGQVWLLPENPAFQPIDGTGCTILGRVEGLIRRY